MYGKTTIFNSGKIISIGTRNPRQAEKDLHLTHVFLLKNEIIPSVSIILNLRNILSI